MSNPGGEQMPWTLLPSFHYPPPKCQHCLQTSPHTLCRKKGPTSLPWVSGSNSKAQAPGPSELLQL